MARTTIWPTSSRNRSDQARRTLTGRFEDITRAAQRVDHGLAAAVNLLAQVRNIELNDVRSTAEVIAPDPVENLRLAQHPFGVAHHETQQLKLGGSQRNRFAGACDLVTVLVEDKVSDNQLGTAVYGRYTGAPQQRSQPQHDFFDAERLGDVVVAACRQTGDAIFDRILRR